MAFKTQEGDFSLYDFQFHSGAVLDELRLHYTTLGQPRWDEAAIERWRNETWFEVQKKPNRRDAP